MQGSSGHSIQNKKKPLRLPYDKNCISQLSKTIQYAVHCNAEVRASCGSALSRADHAAWEALATNGKGANIFRFDFNDSNANYLCGKVVG